MLRKFLKWTGLILLFLIAGVTVATALRQHLTYDAPYPEIKATTDMAVIERGKKIVLDKGCAYCHSSVDNIDSIIKAGQQPVLSGARKFETAFGTFFTPNLTPDAKTGIGSMNDGEIARVLRYGVKSNNEAALPFMQGQNMSDEDITAVISYLRSRKAVENKVPEQSFNILGRFAKAFMVKPALPENPVAVAKMN
ncbi:MAG TPA: cytochrome c [Segetibacter sp.]|nr:cytochrome c [Segetibacter sp.]